LSRRIGRPQGCSEQVRKSHPHPDSIPGLYSSEQATTLTTISWPTFCIKRTLKRMLYQVSFETPASLHSRSVLGSVGGVSENGMLPLIFFSVVGVGIGRLSVIVGSL